MFHVKHMEMEGGGGHSEEGGSQVFVPLFHVKHVHRSIPIRAIIDATIDLRDEASIGLSRHCKHGTSPITREPA